MSHGRIINLVNDKFSICITFSHHDYSIPYSFGVTLICEAFGSFLYHICPSQIIFQVSVDLMLSYENIGIGVGIENQMMCI